MTASTAAPQELVLEAGGMRFGALQWGSPDGPLAMLVHGYPDSAWTWRHVGPILAGQGWRVVAPFTRGYAPTDLAPDDRYLIADLRDDVLALRETLGGDERSVLIGHDWGAVATYAVSAAEPSAFRRYVTMAVPPTPAMLKPFTQLSTLGTGLRQAGMSWYFIYNQLPASERGLDRVIPYLWRVWSPAYDGGEDVARALAALDGPGRRRAALSYYRHNLQRGIVATFTVSPGAPVLYLHGEDDGCMQAAMIEQYPDQLAAGSRFEKVLGVGHFMQLEKPELVAGLISEWIGDPA